MNDNLCAIKARVVAHKVAGNGQSIFWLSLCPEHMPKSRPQAGQFITVRLLDEEGYMPRPFSIESYQDGKAGKGGSGRINIRYDIRGEVTLKMSKLRIGEDLEIKGPLGQPIPLDTSAKDYILVAGGMGLMGLSLLAEELYHGHKSMKLLYGVRDHTRISVPWIFNEAIHEIRRRIVIENEGGGLVTSWLEKELAENENCSNPTIVACGPAEMLAKVTEITENYSCPVLVGLEKVMFCGYGACMGCQVQMLDGEIKKVCHHGSFFDGRKIDWDKYLQSLPPKISPKLLEAKQNTRIYFRHVSDEHRFETRLAGQKGREIKMPYPFMNASGTQSDESILEIDSRYLGAVVTKGVSLDPWSGNPYQRLCEDKVPINSIGLQNSGLDVFLRKELPMYMILGLPVIVNIWGKTVEEIIDVAKGLKGHNIAGVEINLSCGNVAAGGLQFGKSPDLIKVIVLGVRNELPDDVLVGVKYGIESEYEIGTKIAYESGADWVTLINTIRAMKVNRDTWQLELQSGRGGMSGPNIKPAAIMAIKNVANIGMTTIGAGGIVSGLDAVDFFLVRAQAVQIGTGALCNPSIFTKAKEELEEYMNKKGIATVRQIIGGAIS